MSKRLRLLLTTDAIGGVWTYSLDLARGLKRHGVDSVLAVLGPPPTSAQQTAARAAGLDLVHTGLPLDWNAESSQQVRSTGLSLKRLADRMAVDLVQLHSAALAAGVEFDKPVVAVQHSCVATWWEAVRQGSLPHDLAWRTELVREGLACADAVVTPSAAFASATSRLYKLRTDPVVVHNGRAPMAIVPAASHDFAFTSGRLWDEGKNLKTLDEAAAHLAIPVHAAGPIAGPDGISAKLDHLHCLGTLDQEELSGWLARRPVFVSAALYEPFGLSVLEAAMAGCPLILSDIPTFRELWDGAALFVPAKDAKGYARAISDVAGDDFSRGVLGQSARERASRYTVEAMAARMVELYRRTASTGLTTNGKVEARVAA